MSLEKEKGIMKLSKKMLLKIFQHFTEQHLCQVEQVCKRFQKVANKKLLWKLLYKKVYEYDQPLFMWKSCKFKFVSPDECELKNPWKASFIQLYRGVHVRPGFENMTFKGHNLQYFDDIYNALHYVKNKRDLPSQRLVFLHAGTYNVDYNHNFSICIDNNVALIGAASGNVANSVIIKGIADVIRANKDVVRAYVGYLTLELTFDTSSKEYKTNCLVLCGSPTIDHCIIKSFSSNSAAVYVSGDKANPLVTNCTISDCKDVGLHVNKSARGIYEDNTISYNAGNGILINSKAHPTIRRNKIYRNNKLNVGAGIYIYNGRGYFKDNEVHDNGTDFNINFSSNVTIRKNKIFNTGNSDHTQSIGVLFNNSDGILEDNDICAHSNFAVEISDNSDPVVRHNWIEGNEISVFISSKSLGLIEQNYISYHATDNDIFNYATNKAINATDNSNPILKRNYVFKKHEIHIIDESKGFYKLSDEILLGIFKYFTGQHLYLIAQVCTLFQRIANDTLLWMSLYKEIYEYDEPLFNKSNGQFELNEFEFISPDKSTYKNPWKESFKQLYHGVHVRPGFQKLTFRDNNFQYFDTINDALDYVKRKNGRNSAFQCLIFLHAGTYNLASNSTINIEKSLVLIGAAPGNVAKSVIIKSITDIICIRSIIHAYVGFLTLELTPSDLVLPQHCLIIRFSNPIIDHCIIKSSNCEFPAVFVENAEPIIKNCTISDCGHIGLSISTSTGVYKDNTISCNGNAGIMITTNSQPIIRRNKIYCNRTAGIYVSEAGGCFEDNDVYNNKKGFNIKYFSNIIIRKNKIFNIRNQDHIQSIGVSFRDHSYGTLEDNNICNQSKYGVIISDGSNPVICYNIIKDNKIGISVLPGGYGSFDKNTFNNNVINVKIFDNYPILR